jgi:hypothetical protein
VQSTKVRLYTRPLMLNGPSLQDADLVQEYTSQYNHTLEVLPSLVIRPQIWTSMETSGPAICLDIDNPQLGEEVEIAQVSAVSAQWCIGQTLENRR